MRCPVCDGSGRARKRFLLFFTRRAKCARCLGTGVYPPRPIEQVRSVPGFRDDEPRVGFGSGTTGSRDRGDDFLVGSGGRSGGGGSGASWGSTPESDAPVIVDPFTDQRVSTIDTAGAADAGSTDQGEASAGNDRASSTESTGTTY